jgi:3-hydroxyisobutyrate dehydrogenase-like beta-hydroxyacid dehydrogenase
LHRSIAPRAGQQADPVTTCGKRLANVKASEAEERCYAMLDAPASGGPLPALNLAKFG